MQRAHSQLFCSLNRISLPVELTVRCLVNDTSLAESVFGLLLCKFIWSSRWSSRDYSCHILRRSYLVRLSVIYPPANRRDLSKQLKAYATDAVSRSQLLNPCGPLCIP